MPIGKWLGGKLNSELTMTGKLGEDLMPDWQSLTGNGNLFLIEGLLEKFKPLEQLAAKINVEELKQVSLREVRQYFEFTNGKVHFQIDCFRRLYRNPFRHCLGQQIVYNFIAIGSETCSWYNHVDNIIQRLVKTVRTTNLHFNVFIVHIKWLHEHLAIGKFK